MAKSNPVATPLNPNDKLTVDMQPTDDEEAERMKRVPYKEAVGCLMYLAQCTRPDICHAVNVLCRFNEKPRRKTLERRQTSAEIPERHLEVSTNVQEGRRLDDYRGGAISWCCKRQQTVALSTCEAEYMALSAAVQEVLWWKRLRATFDADEAV
ncbi:uncharacterized protein LOC134290909 [Aedes albopictus]|uniref:Reverse transcriptase Ty1/copia-type domain-containing protein n=1 Tax=Aedes albopictus TaxID=7160 RepID=A0ABM1YUV8_AEDAL